MVGRRSSPAESAPQGHCVENVKAWEDLGLDKHASLSQALRPSSPTLGSASTTQSSRSASRKRGTASTNSCTPARTRYRSTPTSYRNSISQTCEDGMQGYEFADTLAPMITRPKLTSSLLPPRLLAHPDHHQGHQREGQKEIPLLGFAPSSLLHRLAGALVVDAPVVGRRVIRSQHCHQHLPPSLHSHQSRGRLQGSV